VRTAPPFLIRACATPARSAQAMVRGRVRFPFYNVRMAVPVHVFGNTCFLCGGRPLVRFAVTPPGSWVRCVWCGMIRQETPPPVSVTQALYGFGQPHEQAISWGETAPNAHLLSRIKILWETLQRRGIGGRLVDVGCGNGHLQAYFRKHGWTETVGLEPSGNPTARLVHGLEIHNEDVETYLRRPGVAHSFDVAIGNHVIEHVYEPRDFLRQVALLVRPGGHILIATPNLTGLSMRWKTLLSRLGLKRRPFRHLDYPKHVVLYNRSNIELLARAVGLRPVLIETYARTSGGAGQRPQRVLSWGWPWQGDNLVLLSQTASLSPDDVRRDDVAPGVRRTGSQRS
jgi:SAM-dependent methyltransferase